MNNLQIAILNELMDDHGYNECQAVEMIEYGFIGTYMDLVGSMSEIEGSKLYQFHTDEDGVTNYFDMAEDIKHDCVVVEVAGVDYYLEEA